jgi:hypothetical protein
MDGDVIGADAVRFLFFRFFFSFFLSLGFLMFFSWLDLSEFTLCFYYYYFPFLNFNLPDE